MAIDGSGPLGQGPIGLRKIVDPKAQEKLHEVAELYEEQFLREMVKAMRGTVQESGLVKVSQGEKIFREQLDQNYTEQWSKQGGLGLSGIIYKQLVEKYGQKLGIKAPLEKPQGPIPINEHMNFNGRIQPSPGKSKLSYQFERMRSGSLASETGEGLVEIKAPWGGSILGSQQLSADEYVLELLHDNGLKSQLVFRGRTGPGLAQGPVQAGDTIGLLSPEAKKFFWNVSANVSATVPLGPLDRNHAVSE